MAHPLNARAARNDAFGRLLVTKTAKILGICLFTAYTLHTLLCICVFRVTLTHFSALPASFFRQLPVLLVLTFNPGLNQGRAKPKVCLGIVWFQFCCTTEMLDGLHCLGPVLVGWR